MGDRCPHCQFPLGTKTRRCGWCGTTVPPQKEAGWRWTIRLQRPQTIAATPIDSVTKTFPLDPAPILHQTGQAPTALLDPSLGGRHDTASTMGHPYLTSHITGASLSWIAPPPEIARDQVPRWWIAVILLALAAEVMLARGEATWGGALTSAGRLNLAVAAALSIWFVAQASQRNNWRPYTIAIAGATALAILGGICLGLAAPATYAQARSAERAHAYNTALDLYGRAGNTDDLLRVRLTWSGDLLRQGDFAGAQRQAETALPLASGPEGPAQIALGQVLWRWGQVLLGQGDLAGARAKWTDAAQRAAGTPDGARAVQALAAPRTITGKLTWLGGKPVVGMHVALVSQWRYSSQLHYVQTGGERLVASTGDDGAFTITNARPGTRYALIWEGNAGDYLATDSAGLARYSVTAQPLQDSDVGQIAIDA